MRERGRERVSMTDEDRGYTMSYILRLYMRGYNVHVQVHV